MGQNKQREAYQSPQQIKAVSHLLQAAQKKHYIQDWQQGERMRLSSSLRMKHQIMNRDDRMKDKQNIDFRSLQKKHERQRLQQQMKECVNNQEDSIILEKQFPSVIDKNLKWFHYNRNHLSQLRSFHSNLTFYHSQRVYMGKNNVSSSLTFYGKGINNQQQRNVSYRQERYHFNNKDKQKMKNSIVYFKPNRSQTIRELVDQMRISKEKNHQIILDYTSKKELQEIHQKYDPSLKQYQIKQINKYKKIISFHEDQLLLLNKIKSGQNIWKRKFKQSWQRKKLELQGKKTYFRRLIVKD